jgi:hypothetical protein
VEETVKSSQQAKKSSHQAVHFDQTRFVCNVRVLTEIVQHGMIDLASKVRGQVERDIRPRSSLLRWPIIPV